MVPEFLTLPAISPAIAAFFNRLAASRWLISPRRDEEGEVPPLILHLVQAPFEEARHVEIEIRMESGSALLRAECGLVDFLSDHVLPGWREESPDSLPVEWRAVVVLEAFLPTEVEEVPAVSARVGAARALRPGPPLGRLHCTVAAAGHRFGISLELSGFEDGGLPELLTLCPTEPAYSFDPGFCCRIYLPGRGVAPAAYRNLETGDVLLAGALEEGWLPTFLEVPDVARFSARLDPDTGAIKLFEDVGNITMGETESDYDFSDTGAIYDEPPLADPTEDLPVRLDLLLSTHRITLSELRELGPGATLRPDIDLTRPVTILANGAPAGRGYLVRIGDHVGVQLSQWAGARHNDGS